MPMDYVEVLKLPDDYADQFENRGKLLLFVENAESKNREIFNQDYLIKMECDVVRVVMSWDPGLKKKRWMGRARYFSVNWLNRLQIKNELHAPTLALAVPTYWI
jgi:hypothetical protein